MHSGVDDRVPALTRVPEDLIVCSRAQERVLGYDMKLGVLG